MNSSAMLSRQSVSYVPRADELIAHARSMIPVLAERASRQEANRRLLPETMAELKQAGFFKILQRPWNLCRSANGPV
jgi:3-hydroxy-9,10-secoandrosta-1,3,5(10)-triene-9,17-dione monooxygenase